IIVSESAHLIWQLRNERRVIQQKDLAANREIRSQTCAMSNRLAIDCLMMNKKKYGSKVISKSLVLRT
ncbi:hypothetical protein C8J56DRAFT_781025, partial [Mycena floridula]